MNSSEKRQCKVSILGDEYSLVTNEREEDFSRSIKLVDNLTREFLEDLPHVEKKRIAVVAALRIASTVVKLENDLECITQKLESLVSSFD